MSPYGFKPFKNVRATNGIWLNTFVFKHVRFKPFKHVGATGDICLNTFVFKHFLFKPFKHFPRPNPASAALAQLLWYSFACGFVSCQAGLPRVGADISSGLHTPIRAALAWTLDQAKMRSHLMRPPEMFVEKIPDSAGAAVLAFAPALLAKVWLAEAFLPAGKGKPKLRGMFVFTCSTCRVQSFGELVCYWMGRGTVGAAFSPTPIASR